MKIEFILKTIVLQNYLLNNNLNILSQHKYNINVNLNSDLPINFDTIKTMMLISNNAYNQINDKNWNKVSYNKTTKLGNDNSIKGYVFSDYTNKNHIIAFKGTSVSLLLDTVINDKYNDNLFFSCCYYKESSIFKNTCDTPDNICSKSCYKKSKDYELNYINVLYNILDNMKETIDFENKEVNIYFTGHSLGGFLATIAGLKYNKQVITFEAPGDRHYLNLIDYDTSNDERIFHFGHTADIIIKGECTLCNWWGYNMKTKCHIGNTCMYDSKTKLKISDSINTHRLDYIIENILPHWENDFPICIKNNCIEENCNKFIYVN